MARFCVATPSGLYAVPAAGGVAKRIDVSGEVRRESTGSIWPEFLPGSEDFLVLSASVARGIEQSEIYLATLRDGRAADPVLLMKNATAARYTPAGGGRLLFVRNDNLYAQTLNRTARKLEGEPELVQQRVASSPAFHVAHFSVSRTGVVAWRPGTAGLSQVTIFDRQGREIGTAGSPTVVQTLRLAPDETRLLIGFIGDRMATGTRPTGAATVGAGVSGYAVVAGRVEVPRCHSLRRERPPRRRTSGDWGRGGSRTGEAAWNGASGRHLSGRQDAAAQSRRHGYGGVLGWVGWRAERPQIPGSDGRDDLTRPLLAGWAVDCVHRLRREWPRRALQRRRNLRAGVPGAGLTEAGDQPRQLSSVAQGWPGNRLPG